MTNKPSGLLLYILRKWHLYYLYYTGVNKDVTQSVLLAISNNPSDSSTWQPQDMVFQSDRPGMTWQDQQNNWFASYLTDYSVTISPLIWDTIKLPPKPILEDTSKNFIPDIKSK